MRVRWFFRNPVGGRWEGTTEEGGVVVTDELPKTIICALQIEADALRDALQEIVDLKDADEDPGDNMVKIATAALEATQ